MKKARRMLLGAIGAACVWPSMMASELTSQDGFDFNEAERMMSFNTVELKDQLYYGLRTFLPDQRAFLDRVVQKVDNGEIPRAMVNVVFVWARKRNPKIPFPYFQVAIVLLAERRGVTI